jgi:hypothetical protein
LGPSEIHRAESKLTMPKSPVGVIPLTLVRLKPTNQPTAMDNLLTVWEGEFIKLHFNPKYGDEL